MSLTVMKYKDGKATPIKLSIWDAFKGVPKPKSRARKPKPCSCCEKIHPRKQEKGEAENPNSKNKETAKTSEYDRSTQPNAIESYSKEDDEKIVEMKTANKSWKEILAAIEKYSVHQLKDHWKLIDPSKLGKQGKEDNDNDKDQNKKKTKSAKDDPKPDKTEGQNKKGQKQGNQQNYNMAKSARKQAKMEAKAEGKVDERGSKAPADQNDRRRWMAAASKHFDRTGQRITPEAARRLAEQK